MKRNIFVSVLCTILILAGVAYLSVAYFLPWYIENRIFSRIGDTLSASAGGRVHRIGPFSAIFGNIRAGSPDEAALSVNSVELDYSPLSLLKKNIDHISINGLVINADITEEGFVLPGLDFTAASKKKTGWDMDKQDTLVLPVEVAGLDVSNGLIQIRNMNRIIPVLFDLEIEGDAEPGIPFAYKLKMQIVLMGEILHLSGSLDPAGRTLSVFLKDDAINLDTLLSVAGVSFDSLQAGRITMQGQADFSLMPFEVKSARLDFHPAKINFNDMKLEFAAGEENPDSEFPVRMELTEQGVLALTANGAVSAPIEAGFDLSGDFRYSEDIMSGTGSLSLSPAATISLKQSTGKKVSIEHLPDLKTDFQVMAGKTDWQAQVSAVTSGTRPFTVRYGSNTLRGGFPEINLTGSINRSASEIGIDLAVPGLEASLDNNASIKITSVSLKGKYRQDKKNGSTFSGNTEFSLNLAETNLSQGTLSGTSDVTLKGTINPMKNMNKQPIESSGKIMFSNARFADAASNISVRGIRGEIPWTYPENSSKTRGILRASEVRWQENVLGSFAADIQLLKSVYSFTGNFKHAMLPDLVTDITGMSEISNKTYRGELALQMEETPFGPLHLGAFAPSLFNIYINGVLGLDGTFSFSPKGFDGSLNLKMQNGRMDFADKGYEINGIGLSVVLPELPTLRSAPAQTLSFERAAVGDILLANGNVTWELEAPDSLFIEEGSINWAGGRVFTNAVRISPDMKEFIIPIFCDRLKLTEILEQFGVSETLGEGTVSGRIPMRLGKGSIVFEDGFLYSSPGQGGSVKVAAFETLAAGIPQNTPQFAQVDFAAEALRNFQYNWVKLFLNSEGEELVMKMQMDGEPLQSLPFSYDSQTGRLQRVRDGSPGIKQPIRLDMNFRLPLNRFMGYGGKFQEILNKIK